MLKLLSKIAAYLIIVIGVVHLSFTPFAYSRVTDNTVWFVGSGLAAIFGGFLNLIWLRNIGRDRVTYWLCLIASLLLALFFVLAAVVIPSPPPLLGVVLIVFEIIAVVMLGKSKSWSAGKTRVKEIAS